MTNHQIEGIELRQWYQQAKEAARTAEIEPYEVDWLLRELSDVDLLKLRLDSTSSDSTIKLRQPWCEIIQLWQQRLQQRVPIQYLVGRTHWRYFTLKVAPGVLIPRPETELIIETAVSATKADPQLQQGYWADLGTGSGAIALGLAEVFPQARIHGIDCSPDAIAIARFNAKQLQLDHRIQFDRGSWWQPVKTLQGQFSGMVSNPPYIPREMITTLQPEVALHEPHLALDGGEDGLHCIRHLVQTAPLYLKPGGVWLIEMMAGQGEQVAALLHQQGSYTQIQVMSDLAGLDRFVLAYKKR
ncbi:MAG: peptide chain release factor N(5)-glutamine methyltransferase [Microcoleaceae cyanobacterium]